MTEREQFEAMMTEFANKPESSFETPYEDVDANAYWAIWQESRRAALEEVAKLVDGEAENARQEHYYPGVVGAFEECAAAIRALANGAEHAN